MFKRGLFQNHNLVAAGGTESITYRASLGYINNEGIALNSGYNRLSTRVNTDIKIRPNLTISSNFNYAESNTKLFGNQRNLFARGAYSIPPVQRPRFDDGTPTPGQNNSAPNPLWYAYIHNDKQKERNFDFSGELNWDIGNKINFDLNAMHHINDQKTSKFEKANKFNGSRPASFSTSNRTRTQLESNLTYNEKLDNHSFSSLVGVSFNNTDLTTSYEQAAGASSDKIMRLNVAPELQSISTNITDETLVGFFGRVTYSYKDKYLLKGVFRADGSSRFAKDNRWGYFPGGSVGWIVSQEPFMNRFKPISLLKLRASYGLTGNNSVGLYDAFGLYRLDKFYAGNAGIRSVSIPSRDLQWETTSQIDIGMDIGLFDDRITLTTDYFDKLTSQLLFNVPLPTSSGYENFSRNVGQVRYYGFEIELSTVNIRTSNFSWTSSFNWNYVQDEVIKLPDNGKENNRIGGFTDANGNSFGGIAEGEPLGRIYGYKVDHIIETQKGADNANFDELSPGWSPRDGSFQSGRKKIGDYEWVDRDGDGRITEADQFNLGNETPNTTGGLTNSFKYRNWSLDFVLDWALGHTVMDRAYQWNWMGVFHQNMSIPEEAYNAWEKPGDETKWAKFVPLDNHLSKNYDRVSDVFAYRADYLAIRNITVGYDFPSDLIKSFDATGLYIYASVYNLHYFTKLEGLTPERGTANTRSEDRQDQGYPMARRITFGVRLKF